ncbi:carboxypeptidase-like regulatory domain-containing protein [Aeoliella sp. ICT_H6.2]|uniref:Carboxypeptidase-like regulatory domain-containing protein n=1 Tax=Aeoliella straminimaris TaxID=2954799 RepID=A0A9X2FB07_9BACT|nr:carboxypeptidase-like regulatory domain-containing protein [Aeoliella straminimaris]MCO6042711.1 carboxypeptidase-like regulatory domain-containing protein [Aeoliella straminimaris]
MTKLNLAYFVPAILVTSAIVSTGTIPQAIAEQRITLKTGAIIVGDVDLEGDQLKIDVDGSKMTLSMSEVISVTPATLSDSTQASHFLEFALERSDTNEERRLSVKLLAEAYRLQPKNPQIAFWYADALADVTLGKQAEQVLSVDRETTLAAYPLLAASLEEKIKKAMAIQQLPEDLRNRLDAIEHRQAQLTEESRNARNTRFYALFRVIDQFGNPVERESFSLTSTRIREDLEAFDDGYYLFTYEQHTGHGRSQECKLAVVMPGYRQEQHSIRGGVYSVHDNGDIILHRFSDEEKRRVEVVVTDANDQPLSNAGLQLSWSGYRSNQVVDTTAISTDSDGKAAIQLFPFDRYSITANAPGYIRANGRFAVTSDEDQMDPITLTLYRGLRASVTLAIADNESANRPRSSTIDRPRSSTIEWSADSRPGYGPGWLHFSQHEDELRLSLSMNPSSYPIGRNDYRLYRLQGQKSGTTFGDIDLTNLDSLPQGALDLSPEFNGGRPPVAEGLKEGDIFFGSLQAVDRPSGEPDHIVFKLRIDSLSRVPLQDQ